MTMASVTCQPGLSCHNKGDVVASVNYYNDPGDGSLPEPVYVQGSTVTNNRATIPKTVTVTDITGLEDTFTLDKNGFQLVRHVFNQRCQADGFRNKAAVEAEYYPAMVRLLKNVTGASRVYIFDGKVRCGPTNWHGLGPGNRTKPGPILRAHIDQSYEGAESLLRLLLPEEAEALLERRWQIINAWRPIKPVRKDPLAVADATTVSEEDLVPARVIYPDHERETWTVKPSVAHRWYFKYAQQPDEVLLFKCYDSSSTVARRAPHTAFEDSRHADEPWRESIEIRCMVFYDAE
ncbi:hypothetical protein VTJ83DRAFT_1325 [Remersonia thermophila]|uniref:Methyltransferase n=1 Tax=Remersonia thermophila TaxID=72144 RepID=A0ABR4DPC8_9PEZI